VPISTTTTSLLLFFFPDDEFEFEAASAFFLDATEDDAKNTSVGFATGLLENADTKAPLLLSSTERKSEKKKTKNHATNEKTLVLLNVLLIVVISLSLSLSSSEWYMNLM